MELKNIFDGCKKPEDIKKLYREYAKKTHPDHGGDAEEFKILNASYLEALQNLNGQTFDERVYNYKQETEEQIIKDIDELLKKKWIDININIVGRWLWLTGNTYNHRRELKILGFSFSGNRKLWYKGYTKVSRNHPGSFKDICAKYGLEEVQQTKNNFIVSA